MVSYCLRANAVIEHHGFLFMFFPYIMNKAPLLVVDMYTFQFWILSTQ